MISMISMMNKLLEHFMKKKRNKLCAKQKGYDNSFNSWIARKDAIEK